MGRTGHETPLSYLRQLARELSGVSETMYLAEELTVGETYFFRHSDQFRAFTDVALLPRLRSVSRRPRLRILSAGCSSGEEAYSLAILLKEHAADLAGLEADVVGIDVNPVVLAKAARAQYSAWSMRGVSADVRRRYFSGDKIYALDDAVQAMVKFENRNLHDDADDFWLPGQFDVIFCRNVTMYFTPESTRQVIGRLTRALAPGGYLFLGPAETLRGISQDYHLRHSHETFYYQLRAPEERQDDSSLKSRTVTDLFDNCLPALEADDCSWVDAISQASERISRLSRELAVAAPRSDSVLTSIPDPASRVAVSDEHPLHAARTMVHEERFTEALEVIQSLSFERQDADAQLLHAVILTNRGDVGEAEKLCHLVLAGDELSAEARYVLALCREYDKEYEAATEQDQTAIYLDRQFAMPHLHLGLLSKRNGDRAAARREFQEARTLLPREDPARILLFGGGFSREMLIRLCDAELVACGGASSC